MKGFNGIELCSGPEWHNISPRTNRCHWCGLSMMELVVSGTFGGQRAEMRIPCPHCRTMQALSPSLPGEPRRMLAHSVANRRCKGSGWKVPGTEGQTWEQDFRAHQDDFRP